MNLFICFAGFLGISWMCLSRFNKELRPRGARPTNYSIYIYRLRNELGWLGWFWLNHPNHPSGGLGTRMICQNLNKKNGDAIFQEFCHPSVILRGVECWKCCISKTILESSCWDGVALSNMRRTKQKLDFRPPVTRMICPSLGWWGPS